ncbi:hypothetical protein DL93DRAFT_582593 [Clavulina sp. PMI_390]|nr:hypothetical protein DL93DRAFT_582593 [Clavulina sp. PMI_390]
MHYWHADVIKKHVFMFMSWLVERTPGKFDQFVLAATLTQWLHDMALNIGSHCFMLVPEVGDNGPEFKVVWCGLEVLSTGGLYPRLRQLVEAITDAKHLLKSSPRPKFYIGLEEHVFIQQTSLHSIPTARDPRIPLQRLSIGLIEFVQGSRPSSLAARAGTKAREKGEFAKLRHFTIRRTDEPASFEVTFKVTELKGYFSSARKAHDDTLYKPTSHPSSILIDPIAIVLDFFYRGALCVEDLDDLLFGDQAVIDIKSEFLDTPLFCAIGPKSAALVNPIAPGTSQAWGAQVVQLTKTALGVPMTAYGYRREFIDRLIAAFDNETAATFVNHSTPYKTATRHYSRTKVNVDLVAVAAMEGSVTPRTLMRGKMLRFTGIALEFHARKQALKREIPKNRATNTVVDNDGDDASDADAAPKSSRGRGSAKASIVVTAEELEAELEVSCFLDIF